VETETLVRLENIVKRFGPTLANDRISLEVRRGEVHALLGENGAGKTTLMNILYGMYQPDEGRIYVRGQEVRIRSPRDALALGIGMVHQHFMLVPVFTTAENIALTDVGRGWERVDLAAVEAKVGEIAQAHGLRVVPGARVGQLPVGLQQQVEILKLLYHGAELLIMDEPTAVLTPQESEGLFKTLRSLADAGRSVIFISHKLEEVLELSDRITVLRRGRVVGTLSRAEATKDVLVRMMVGRELERAEASAPGQAGEKVLELIDVRARDERGLPALRGINLYLRQGEILGIAGVEGNGQSELAEVVTGLRQVEAGQVRVGGRDLTNAGVREFLRAGVGYIPADRDEVGSVKTLPVKENYLLRTSDWKPVRGRFLLSDQAIGRMAQRLVAEFDVRAAGLEVPAGTLSGGNLQKLILSRELSRQPRILICSHPTRGLDIAATQFVHTKLREARARGAAVLLISGELEELFELSDRLLVLYRGEVVGEVNPREASLAEVGLLMAGVRPGTTPGSAVSS
jgi:simple sugar transport system ATP-binding protein